MGKGAGNKNSSKINSKRGTTVAGAFAESFNLEYDFDLYTLQDDGQTPTTFAGALENFNGSLTHFSSFDPNLPVFNFFQDDFDVGREQGIEFTSETSDLQASFDATNNQLEYQVVNNDQLTALGVTELSFYINDSDDAEGFQNGVGKTIDLDLATASNGRSESEAIEYIVSEDLFDFDGAIISGLAADGSDEAGQIISREAIFLNGTGSEVISVDVEPPIVDPVIIEPPIIEPPIIEPPIIESPIIESPIVDPVIGAEGGDVVSEFNGDNPLNRTVSNDTFSGAAGDSVNLDGDNPNLDPILSGDDLITGDNSDNTLLGEQGNNVLRGQEGNDVLETGSGSDNLDGGNGNLTLRSGGDNDTLTGGAGADNIDGGEGNDTIDGGDQDDLILGGTGDDLINGGNGNDTLNGGTVDDVLVGDGGADIFALNTLSGSDTIRDFSFDQDRIGLSDDITFDDLAITQGDGAAIISYQGQAICSVSGATPSQLEESLFTTI